MTIKLITPLAITDSVLTASTVAENDYAAWNAGTAYNVGDRVIRTTTHRIYERLVAGTTATAPESDTMNWRDAGATNRWKMFDTRVSSQTTKTGGFSITLVPGTVVTSLACLNLSECTSVNVTMTAPGAGTVYNQTITLDAPPLQSEYWNYFFDPIVPDTLALFFDIPPYYDGTITVTFDGTGAVACGAFLVGPLREFGIEEGAQTGARLGINDYSRKERNTFGDIELVERLWSDWITADILVENDRLDYTKRLLTSLRATPTLYIVAERYESMTVFGFAKNFAVTIPYTEYSQCSLELDSLT